MLSKIDKLPNIKAAISPPQLEFKGNGINSMNQLGITREKSIAAAVANSQAAVNNI